MEHVSKDELVLLYYGEVESDQLHRHVEACVVCREEYQALQRLLNTMDAGAIPERDAGYGMRVWAAVEARVRVRRCTWGAMGALAAGLIVGGVLHVGSQPVLTEFASGQDAGAGWARAAAEGQTGTGQRRGNLEKMLGEVADAPANCGQACTVRHPGADKIATKFVTFEEQIRNRTRIGLAMLMTAGKMLAQPVPVPVTQPAPSLTGAGADLYRSAVRLIDERQYEKAVLLFDQVVREKGPQSEGALYWKAYSQRKLGKSTEALATLRGLMVKYARDGANHDLQLTAIDSLGAVATPEAIRALARAEKDAGMKKETVRRLSSVPSKEAQADLVGRLQE